MPHASPFRPALPVPMLPAFVMIALASLLLLGGCTKTSSRVEAFSDLPKDTAGSSYVFAPTEEQSVSVQYRAFAYLAERNMAKAGWVRVDEGVDSAQYAVQMRYAISTGNLGGALYERYFSLRISERQTGEAVYETSAVSVGAAAHFGEVADCMIKAALKKFPESDTDIYNIARVDCDA